MVAAASNAPASAQESRREEEAPPPRSAPELGSDEALSVRYRFIEKYGVEEDPSQPDLVTQYQVGIRESSKSIREKPQGAPDRLEWSTGTVYIERPAKVTKAGDVSDAVRRYDRFFQKGLTLGASEKTPLFSGLTVWITRGMRLSPPLVLSLTNDRQLREPEFEIMVSRTSMPPLKALLPSTPQRVADTWKVPRAAAFDLFVGEPDAGGYDLNATLKEVSKAAVGTKLVAVIGISGELTLSDELRLVNGEISFEFEPPPASAPPPGIGEAAEATAKSAAGRGSLRSRKVGVVEARGWIKEVKIAWKTEFPDPESDGRLKTTETHELYLARRLLSEIPKKPGEAPPAPLTVPNPPPTATQTNSWLVYEDPLGRFSFRHPQVLRPLPGDDEGPDRVQLADPGGGKDRLLVLLQPKGASAERQLAFHDPEHFQRAINETWSKLKLDILRGPVGFLTGEEWNQSKRKVYRMEAGLKSPKASGKDEGRVFIDYYLIDVGNGKSFILESWTDRDDHVSFRNEAEAVIKTFEFGTWKPRGSPTSSPSVEAPPPR